MIASCLDCCELDDEFEYRDQEEEIVLFDNEDGIAVANAICVIAYKDLVHMMNNMENNFICEEEDD